MNNFSRTQDEVIAENESLYIIFYKWHANICFPVCKFQEFTKNVLKQELRITRCRHNPNFTCVQVQIAGDVPDNCKTKNANESSGKDNSNLDVSEAPRQLLESEVLT